MIIKLQMLLELRSQSRRPSVYLYQFLVRGKSVRSFHSTLLSHSADSLVNLSKNEIFGVLSP